MYIKKFTCSSDKFSRRLSVDKMRYTWYLIFVLCGLGRCYGLKYEGYRIYQIIPKTDDQVEYLFHLSESYPEFDFLSVNEIINSEANVIVSPENSTTFEKLLSEKSLDFKVINYDLSETIRKQQTLTPRTSIRSKLGFSQEVSFKKYHRYNEINAYLDNLAKKYRNYVKVASIGKSHENRDINIISITDGTPSDEKNIIFIDAGIHAREWLSIATALYAIHQLVEKLVDNRDILKNYKWVILPMVNPDGYRHTHKKNRNWRKTMKPNKKKECSGTDGNRNFDFRWGQENKDKDECSITYRGEMPFSEPETRAVRDLMRKLKKHCKMYISLHSFGRYLLLPWSAVWEVPEDYLVMHKVAKAGHDAILSDTKKTYMIGNPPRVLNKVSGSSMDYAHGEIKIPVTITIELAPGGDGFDPTTKELQGLAHEGWIGIKAMAKKLQEIYP